MEPAPVGSGADCWLIVDCHLVAEGWLVYLDVVCQVFGLMLTNPVHRVTVKHLTFRNKGQTSCILLGCLVWEVTYEPQ